MKIRLVFEAAGAEVEEESGLEAVHSDVVSDLGNVDVLEGGKGFYFDDDTVSDDEVGAAGADFYALVEDGLVHFSAEVEAGSVHFDC